MKIIGIFMLMMGLLTLLSISLDIIFLHFTLREALIDWIRPFFVMTIADKIIFFLYPLLVIFGPLFSFYQKKRRKEKA